MAFIVPHIRQDFQLHNTLQRQSPPLALQKCRSDCMSAVNFGDLCSSPPDKQFSTANNGQTIVVLPAPPAPCTSSADPFQHVLPPTPPLTPPIIHQLQTEPFGSEAGGRESLREWLFPNCRVSIQPLPPLLEDGKTMRRKTRNGQQKKKKVRFGVCERVEWDSGNSEDNEDGDGGEEDPWPELAPNHPERLRRMRLRRRRGVRKALKRMAEEEQAEEEAATEAEAHCHQEEEEASSSPAAEEEQILRRTRALVCPFGGDKVCPSAAGEDICEKDNINPTTKETTLFGGKYNTVMYRLLASLRVSSKK